MEIVRILLTVVFIIVCLALIGIVLLQEGKSAGLGAIAGAAESYWGKNKGRSMEGALVKITTVLGVVFMILAIMSSNCAASMLWSRYCPSLRDTGVVSSATGFLDFLSYSASSIANRAFAAAITEIGWSNLILVWIGIVLLGVIVALPYRRRVQNVA